jgi:ABC-type transport system involved in cytochrome c biogenesis permease subunit
MASEMATEPLSVQEQALRDADHRARRWVGEAPLVKWLMPLASLQLTVVLFFLAIVLVFAGTLAQVDQDIWEVMEHYFRTWLAWIPFQVFFPRSFFAGGEAPQVPGGTWFPGGFAIGTAMGINLLAAHALRFKVQARGARLLGGLAVLVLGILLTGIVIAGGSGKETLEGAAPIEWSTLWTALKWSLVAVWGAGAYALWQFEPNRKVERRILAVAETLLGALLVWIFYQGEAATLGDSSLRILWQLTKGGLAAVVLLAGCVLLFRKRAGIVLLHAGVGLVMANELVVYGLHVEGQMHIREGETVQFVQDIRTVELAVVDPSDPKTDDVVVVPRSFLQLGSPIRDENLPFDIEIVEYLQNAELKQATPKARNQATAGAGRQWIAEPRRAAAGADAGAKVDSSAAYLKLLHKGTQDVIGVYLVDVELLPQKVTLGDKSYDLALRFKRDYKPYSIQLVDVRADNYLGTQTAKNYSSDVRVVDKQRNIDRDVKIWMNNPLRFSGETFYQSGYNVDERGREVTTLQVVTNSGWMIPYVACMLVGVGMLAQFGGTLTRFLRRYDEELTAGPRPTARGGRKQSSVPRGKADWVVPAGVVGLAAVFTLSLARVPSMPVDQMQLDEFGRLPVVYEGRVKPLDTVARNVLRTVSDRQSFRDDAGQTQPAIRWLLDAIVSPETAFKHKVFRIDHPEVQELLGLKRRDGLRYAPDEFWDRIGELERQAEQASHTDPGGLTVYQKQVTELVKNLRLFLTLNSSFKVPPIRMEKEHFHEDWTAALEHLRTLQRMQPPLVIPPTSDDSQWESFAAAVIKNIQAEATDKKPNPATVSMATLLYAYRKNDAKMFNEALAEYERSLSERPPADYNATKVNFEAFFNYFAPFWWAAWLYLAAFVLVAVSWLVGWRPLGRAAFWLVVFTLGLHLFALVSRIYISGRPPVTNLYSSAVFIGFGAVIFGIVFEMIYRIGIGTVVASVIGFSTLLIAYFLSASGDTFSVLVAVLDTQFWLATHVTCITLGYSTTCVAGALGVLYILLGVATPALGATVNSSTLGKVLSRMIYGTVCFAMFFSFIGTVLGGLWADDSWGRFWGWDPKENGALIIVLWNALILHARWGGIIRDRGLAALAVSGNIVTSWSWFGVNELGVGLHSYGFTEGVLLALGIFIATQLAIVALAALPRRWWSSYRREMAQTG